MRDRTPIILVLGGTAEARALAAVLVDAGYDIESSLAGRVSTPRLPAGRVRIGGFGGAPGLAAYLRRHKVSHLVDATHPFAAQMSAHAVEASLAVEGVELLRLVRPGWSGHRDAGSWRWVPDLASASLAAERIGKRPFVTTGRQSVPFFAGMVAEHVLLRVVDPIESPAGHWSVVHDRGPYDLTSERELMTHYRVDVVVTKDSGGLYTSAKLDAASALGIPVVVVSRPPIAASTSVALAHDIPEVLAWLS